MTWQYRLMRRSCSGPAWYEIVRYYTEEDGSHSWSTGIHAPSGQTPEECKEDYALMAEAFAMPVLDEALLTETG
jgi:hypothetical protein